MKKKEIEIAANRVSFDEAEEADIYFWADKSIKERVGEASKWIDEVWKFHDKVHGKRESIKNGKHLKSQTDDDDF